jgi:hypothetical protein
MAQRSDVDRRAKRYAPKQCVADHGMHKDAPDRSVKAVKTRCFWPLKDTIRRLHRELERRP